MATSETLALTLPPATVEAIAEQAARLVLARLAAERQVASPYLTVAEAAAYLRCSRQRVYDLLCAHRLNRYRDGRRVLVARADPPAAAVTWTPRTSPPAS